MPTLLPRMTTFIMNHIGRITNLLSLCRIWETLNFKFACMWYSRILANDRVLKISKLIYFRRQSEANESDILRQYSTISVYMDKYVFSQWTFVIIGINFICNIPKLWQRRISEPKISLKSLHCYWQKLFFTSAHINSSNR